jgi:DNA-binding NarL/FixJ family response regulator
VWPWRLAPQPNVHGTDGILSVRRGRVETIGEMSIADLSAEFPAVEARPRLRVLIADDHPLLLAGLRRTLEAHDDMEVVGQAQSGPELLALIERRQPSVVLTDLRMPGVDGFDLVAQIHGRWPQIKLLVLSASDDRESVEGALRAGASAFIIKSTEATDVAAVLRQVGSGAVFHAPAVTLAPAAGPAAVNREDEPALTQREQQILAAVARGCTTAAISRELWVSEHTVKFHLTNIYRKLGVVNRSAAVRYAVEHDLVS